MARQRADRRDSGAKPLKERLSAAALEERLKGVCRSRQAQQEAELLAVEEASLEAERREAESHGATRQQRRAQQRRGEKLRVRTLRLLKRDDAAVIEVVERERRIDDIVDGSQPTELDELVWFMAEELELTKALEGLAPPETYFDEESGKEITRRRMYPALVLNLLGVMSRYMGLSSGPEIQAELLTDPRWMGLLGFSPEEVLCGATRRSEALLGKTRDGQGGSFEEAGPLGPARARVEGPRGALSSQTMAEHEGTLRAEDLVALFNTVVRAMARRGVFAKEVRGVLDSTGEEVVPSFEGAGKVRKKVKAQSRARRPRQVEVTVLGFKLWYLMEVETGLPLAFAFDTIEKPEKEHAKAVIDQARANLKGFSRLVSVALDRGFLDGDLLWWLKKVRQIDWVCPSKEKMDVTAEARARVAQVLSSQGAAAESALETARRLAQGGRAQEGVIFFERQVAANRESLVVAQVDGLLCTDFYGQGGASSSRLNSKKFRPTALHATVVLSWPDRSAKDVEDEREHDEESKGPVVLLSPVAEHALVRYDHYDERSLIENRLNRDGKQHFGLGVALARNRAALLSATVFSTLALMFYRGLELHEERMVEHLDRRAEALGVLRYRRQRMLQNRGTVIVIVGDLYARLTMHAVMRLVGVEVSRAPRSR